MSPTVPLTAPQPAPLPASPIPSLDGIRALAVTLVFLAHSGLERFVPGGLGVTIFFVLSGYLITTLLRREFAADGTLDLRAFYLRRLLRLMPPLTIVVAGAALLAQLQVVQGRFSATGLLSVLFYLGNYFVIGSDFRGIPAGVGVVWSLAVEEHFYLLFPLLALALLRRGRSHLPAVVLGTMCVGILAWRCWLALHGASETYIGMATDTRADAILVGCIMAFVRNPAFGPLPLPNRRRDAAIVVACLALLLATLACRNEFFRLSARYTLQSLAIAPLVYLAVARAADAPFRWLGARPLVYLGSISYTVYLSHQVVLEAVTWHWPELGWAATLVLSALMTLAIAEAMRRWVEAPCLRLRRALHQHRPERSTRAGTPEIPATAALATLTPFDQPPIKGRP